ncbi:MULTISPECIES: hypothetical protein [Novosphingobium]|jgi:hypothetical protein|nr:hypothetical protein [Novosphingobium resinovorum]
MGETMGDLSVGAIGAAVIAGLVSLMGLIISKESKISDFRQEWVNSLRSEVVNFLVSSNQIVDAFQGNEKNIDELQKIISPLYSKLNESSFLISLRLNASESQSQKVLSAMHDLVSLLSSGERFGGDRVRPLEAVVLTEAKLLLKAEWKRVKRGEFIFTFTKWSLVAALMAASSFLMIEHAGGISLGFQKQRIIKDVDKRDRAPAAHALEPSANSQTLLRHK